jgi:PTS system mannitol-specific IIA component/PTS system ascorbate-specific IIA component
MEKDMKFLNEQLVAFNVTSDSAEEAIREAGKLLLAGRLITEGYVEAMVASYRKNGPYFVLAPQIALPHARPEDGAREACVSLVRLKQPVPFGHPANDPVQLVFALGASSSEEHLELLQRLSLMLGNPENIKKLIEAETYQDITEMIGGE